MKNIISKFIIVFTLIFITINSNAQDRNIIWAHGLGGDETHWQHYENLFNNERQINSVNEQYTSGSGISTATVGLRVDINNNLNASQENDTRNLGIGHSLGGVVLRNLDKTTNGTPNQRIGGFITINSPNYGAPIVNSIQNGNVTSAAQNAFNKITDGPLSQALPMPWTILPDITTDIFDSVLFTENTFGGYASDSTSDDLLPSSTFLNNLNNFDSTLPRISIWGEENSPVHWRSISTQGFTFLGIDFYGNNDYAFPNTMNTVRGVYNGFFIYNTTMAIVCAVGGFWNPICWALTGVYTYRAVQWKKGRNWIDDSENIWSSLIKTTRSEPQTYWVEVWVPCNYPPLDYIGMERLPDPDCGEWVWQQRTRYVSVNYPSDGLLPQYTQELQGITWNNRYKILGANHMEVLNMSNSTLNGQPNDGTRQRLDDIFDRDDWFNTPE